MSEVVFSIKLTNYSHVYTAVQGDERRRLHCDLTFVFARAQGTGHSGDQLVRSRRLRLEQEKRFEIRPGMEKRFSLSHL